jgi:hypothetical protein
MRLMLYLGFCLFIFSCQSGDTPPDVSKIKVNLKTIRFEKELFSIDSSSAEKKIDSFITRSGEFGILFMTQILNADPHWSNDTVGRYVGSFINSYQPVYLKAEKLYYDFSVYENEIKHSLQFV